MSVPRVDLSLVLACYGEERILEESVRQIVEVLDSARWSWEVIFVDDASRDGTRGVIDALIAGYGDRPFRRLFHEHNTGRGRTVADGFRLAHGRFVGFIDVDLEVHPRYIPSMLLALEDGADVATAHRVYKLQPRLFSRFLASQGYVHLMRWALGVHVRDPETGFKFFRRERIMPLLDEVQNDGWFWDTEIMVRSLIAGLTIREVPCLFIRRYDKASTVRLAQDSLEYAGNLWRFRGTVRELRADGELADVHSEAAMDPTRD
jgi:glycosyltransferase involved in cell wall biosynthesis